MVNWTNWPAFLYPFVRHDVVSPCPPVATIAVLPGTFAASVAVATFAAFTVGTPPARSGGLATVPFGTDQLASVTPQSPVPGGGALLTLRMADALWPVLMASMKRLFVVLVSAPVAVGVTFTLITQLLFAASVPLENVIELAPATAVSVGVPQPLVVAAGGVATTRFAGRLSTKL